ncbi:helix-hairpin-helix domain-containing protein [uncultured Eubacterium sp.]|uniref:ComEA family DNA-binding protein n=1 Tax=uncultured Eubacterium sp. TaxID=165185 RepID=UPI0015AEE11F|nr:helix-hairpin-helix domain-containing protein [uncultured Eubacterium sp.]
MSARKQTLILISIALILIGAILVYVGYTSPRVYDKPVTAENEAFYNDEASEFLAPINLNTASAEQLMTVKGIGEAKAESIISYRSEHSGFQSVEELKEVDGIGEALYEQISGSFTV